MAIKELKAPTFSTLYFVHPLGTHLLRVGADLGEDIPVGSTALLTEMKGVPLSVTILFKYYFL